MSLDEAIEMLDKAEKAIEEGMKKISEEIAMDAVALIVNRIQQHGLPGRKYSDTALPLFFYTRNADKKGALKKLAKAKGGVSYKDWRSMNGLQTDHVDLTFTGRMWQNVGIVGTVRNGDSFITICGGFDKEVKDKLRWNAQRFGDFFMVTNEEKEQLKEIFKNRVSILIKSIIV